ncbi:MAG: helicase-related protein [Candidatus Thorarchaeota archaeon]|nr:helicase-related protein [Candidatus Thorarchaeota archaeon]
MSKPKPKYTPRGYQSYILDRVSELKDTPLLLELDCGLGKRFITHQIVAEKFPEAGILIIVHSSSSLVETVDYLRGEYGGLEEDLGELSSRIQSGNRIYNLREKRVIVATPQVLTSTFQKDASLFDRFKIVLINEVDTLVRRSGGRTALVYPWPALLTFLKGKWVIGMSGTLRDDHAVFTKEQIEIRDELATLREYIQGAELITMEDLYGTDVEDFLEPTFLSVSAVSDTKIRSISKVLDELIRTTRAEIMSELEEDGNLDIVDGDSRRVHLLLERLPISEELKGRYTALLMLRKYVYAMPPKQFLRMFYGDYIKNYFNISELRRILPTISAKVTRILKIASEHNKTLVLTSYLEMVSQIKEVLEKSGFAVLTITGQSHDKADVLRAFREDDNAQVLVMSPVGERDLDIPHAEVMIVCDTINTTKTMYQKFKRTRGGLVMLLVYSGTSEELKVRRLMNNILQRYPWSTAILETSAKELA